MPSEKQIEAATTAIVDKIKTDGFIGYREAVSIILIVAEQAEPAPAARTGGVKVKALDWIETASLGGRRKLIALDCFHNEFGRIDLPKSDREIEAYKAALQHRYDACILSALEPAPEAQQEPMAARPSDQAITDEMVEAGAKAIVACRFEDESEPVTDYDLELSRAALKAAMEAGR